MAVQTVRRYGLKPLVAGMLAGCAMSSVWAFDDDLGALAPLDSAYELGLGKPTFLDTLTFSLNSPMDGSFVVKGRGFSLPGLPVVIPAAKDLSFAMFKGGINLTGFGASFSGLHLAAGSDYSFEVMGKSGLYHVTWCLSPVPEPETLALALAGAAMVVGTARRRWSQSWRA